MLSSNLEEIYELLYFEHFNESKVMGFHTIITVFHPVGLLEGE